jgi:hypothetical protein
VGRGLRLGQALPRIVEPELAERPMTVIAPGLDDRTVLRRPVAMDPVTPAGVETTGMRGDRAREEQDPQEHEPSDHGINRK